MVKTAACPDVSMLQKLAAADLPPDEMEPFLEHLHECATCLAKLPTLANKDTLVDVVAKAKTRSETPDDPLLAGLIARLTKMRQPAAAEVAAALPGSDGQRTPPSAVPEPASLERPPQTDAGKLPLFSPWSKSEATSAFDIPKADDTPNFTEFLAPAQASDELGRLGKYRILKVLGHGGMGVVFQAEDTMLKRTVALKAMLPALAANGRAGKRFLREAEAMAAVEHDHIVRIYQIDEDRGVPFMAMEFLKGEPLDERLQRESLLPLTEVLRIGREIAKTLAAAHATGLIHRDIKPANIWLEAPEQRVKILDFGLARAAEQDSALTQQGAIVGTPAYMAPEQGRGDTVDARVDLFSLGVVLYRLCTGEAPFLGKDTVSPLMSVALYDPEPPIRLNAELPQGMSDLVMKLLEKDPAQRLATASEVVHALQTLEKNLARATLAQDQTPALDADPLQRGSGAAARPGSRTAPGKTPPRRRSRTLVALALAALALVAASIVFYVQTNNGLVRIEITDPKIKVTFDQKILTFHGVDKEPMRVSAGEHGLHIERDGQEFDTKKFLVKRGETIALKIEWLPEGKLQVVQNGKVIDEKVLLPVVVNKDKGTAKDPLLTLATLDHLDPSKIPVVERLPWHTKEVVAVLGEHRGRHWTNFSYHHGIDTTPVLSFSADGKTLFCSNYGSKARLIDAVTLREKAVLWDAPVLTGGFSLEGKTLLTVVPDHLRLWDVSGPEPKIQFKLVAFATQAVSFSKDGKTLAAASGYPTRFVKLWDLSGAQPKERPGIKNFKGRLFNLALSPDGKTLATCSDGGVRLWDLSGAGPKERIVLYPGQTLHWALFSPDGKTLVMGFGRFSPVRVWDLTPEQPKERAAIPAAAPVAFSPDSKTLACGQDLYDLTGPEPRLKSRLSHHPQVLTFSPDGKAVATGNELGLVQVWDLTDKGFRERVPLEGHLGALRGAMLAPDGKTVATFGGTDPVIRLWDVTGAAPGLRAELRGHTAALNAIAFAPDSKTLAACSGNSVMVWDLSKAKPEERLRFLADGTPVASVRFSPDGKILACSCKKGIVLMDVSGEEPKGRGVLPKAGASFAFALDGQTLASFRQEKEKGPLSLVLWDLSGPEPKERALLKPPDGYPYSGALAWAPDGTLAVLCTQSQYPQQSVVQVWNTGGAEPKERAALKHQIIGYDVLSLAYAPDGKTLAVSHYAFEKRAFYVTVWEVAKGEQRSQWRMPGPVNQVSFAPDSRHLITANNNGTAYILRLSAEKK